MADCTPFQQAFDELKANAKSAKDDCDGFPLHERQRCKDEVDAAIQRAKQALDNCLRGLPDPGVQEASGRVTFLRANDGGYGPPDDHLDSDIIFMLDTQPGRAFGIKLDTPAREASAL